LILGKERDQVSGATGACSPERIGSLLVTTIVKITQRIKMQKIEKIGCRIMDF